VWSVGYTQTTVNSAVDEQRGQVGSSSVERGCISVMAVPSWRVEERGRTGLW
jgi:hypothetical protein